MIEHLIPEDVHQAASELVRVSRKYLALKIATIKEQSDSYWPKFVKKYGIEVGNLHLTIQGVDEWKQVFAACSTRLLYESNPAPGFCILIYEV